METLFPTSLVSNSRLFMHQGRRSTWTKEENKTFESALAIFDEETPNRWLKVAAMIPGKSIYDVINQYRELVADVNDIEAGLVPIPGYLSPSFTLELHRGFDVCRKRGKTCEQQRKKGVPWTEEEHRLFLLGLQKHGKGDWKNISRNFVVSKTPTQVASHAQKYYLRQLSVGKDKKRPSIHDITVHLNDTSQSDDSKPRLVEKSNELTSLQKHTNIPQILDWSDNNDDGTLIFSNSFYDDSLISYPCNIATQSHCIADIGAYTPGSHIVSTRFHG